MPCRKLQYFTFIIYFQVTQIFANFGWILKTLSFPQQMAQLPQTIWLWMDQQTRIHHTSVGQTQDTTVRFLFVLQADNY